MADSGTVVVAGAGPGGCIFARDLARAGVPVVVYEQGTLEDLGHDWSDAVERSALAEAGFPVPPEAATNRGELVKRFPGDPAGIFEEHAYPEMDVWAPDYSCCKKIRFRYITTDRRALGRLLAEQAREAGAEIRFRHQVVDLAVSGSTLGGVKVNGVRVRDLKTGEERDEAAHVVADDTGFHARLRTRLPAATGIARKFSDAEMALVHRTVRRRDRAVADPMTDHYRYGYRTGYQWVQFLNQEEIDAGAGVRHDPANPDPKEIVEEFISRHPSITGDAVRGGGGLCLVGRSPASLAAGGFVAIGDAAGQTIPMTGCGAGGAMVGGVLAARAVAAAVRADRSDIASLWPYNHAWFVQSGRGANYAGLTALRNGLQSLTHEEISFLFRRDIFSGDMLTPSINGVFRAPDLWTMARTLAGGISRPGLLLKLNQAITLGTRIFRHYMAYPPTWDAAAFEAWRTRADRLFEQAGA